MVEGNPQKPKYVPYEYHEAISQNRVAQLVFDKGVQAHLNRIHSFHEYNRHWPTRPSTALVEFEKVSLNTQIIREMVDILDAEYPIFDTPPVEDSKLWSSIWSKKMHEAAEIVQKTTNPKMK